MVAKAFHIILSAAVLLSTTGFTLSRHFCQNKLAGTAIFVKSGCKKSGHQGCMKNGHCGKPKDGESKNCCNDDTQYFKTDLEKQSPSHSGIDFLKKPELVIPILMACYLKFTAAEAHLPTYQQYKPPIVCTDFQSMLQTYRL